jgi:alpha-amylase
MSSPANSKERHDVILYFQVHQPRRLSPINFFDLGNEPHYFNDDLNRSIVQRVSRDCYLPANKLLLDIIRNHPGVKITFSLSGVVIDQFEAYAPEVIKSFQDLAATGHVEFLSETYYHSLASLVNTEEFEIQVLEHAEKIVALFGVRPLVFRNTELIYGDDIGKRVAMMGFLGIFAEGHEKLLGQKSPHSLYCHPEHDQLKIFLRNYRLSDDIAFRFMEGGSSLSIERYFGWLRAMPSHERLINLAMDYETFGEHHKAATGIFDFLQSLLTRIAGSDQFSMIFPSEAAVKYKDATPLSANGHVSWGDLERDLSAWLGNDMQKDAFNSIMKLESDVKGVNNKEILEYWRYLQTSDHFYYMSIKTDSDGSVHSYFSPFPSSYEAFINYMNVVTHLTLQINEEKNKPAPDVHDSSTAEAERQNLSKTTPVWAMNLESHPHGHTPDDWQY